jgi:hypothetical protein
LAGEKIKKPISDHAVLRFDVNWNPLALFAQT